MHQTLPCSLGARLRLEAWSMKRLALPSAALALCVLTGWTPTPDGGTGPWNVPGDVPAMVAACRNEPNLQTFCRNGYLAIESGYQAILFGSRVPVAPAPNVPWAKPYARGPIRLLIITSFGNAPTDIAQLAQVTRELDCDVRWVLVADAAVTRAQTADELYRTSYLPAQARAALAERYDVILMSFGTVTPQHGYPRAHPYFPDDIYQIILGKVRRGTGLVLVGQNVGDWWVTRTPLATALPATMTGQHWKFDGGAAEFLPTAGATTFAELGFDSSSYTKQSPLILYGWQLRPGAQVLAQVGKQPAIMTRTYGQGQVVLLGWDGTLYPQPSSSGRTDFEHNTALALRAITVAARKPPPLTPTVKHAVLQAGEPSTVTVTVSAAATLKCVVRTREFSTLSDSIVKARAGDNPVQVPALPAGRYWMDLIARDANGRALGWSSHELVVQSALTLSVKTDKDSYRIGETVRVSATINGMHDVRGMSAVTEIRDAADRLLAVGPAHADGGTLSFAYTIRDAQVAPHRATLNVTLANMPVLQASTQFFVPRTGWHDYENIVWPTSHTLLNAALRDDGGFTAALASGGPNDVDETNASHGFHNARMNDAGLDPGLIQTRPASAFTHQDQALASAIAVAQRYGTLAWALQDERHQVADAGMPDVEGLRRFREYLAHHYTTLAALNTSWATRYASWNDVQPVLTPAPKGKNNLAPWVDFRLYVADQEFQADKRHADMVRSALGASTYIGLDGFTTSRQVVPYGALDFGRLAAEGVFNFYCPYDDDLLIASMIKGPKAKYLGWSMPRAAYFSLPWRDAFRGHWGTFRFFGPTFYSDFGWLQPAGRWTGEGTQELRNGIGKLLMGSRRALSPIVILYSYPSMMTAAAAQVVTSDSAARPSWESMDASRSKLEQMLLGSGVSFGYQTDAQIAAGSLARKRLLIIPAFMGMALSQATCDAITQFVKNGGIVLADVAPAVYDEHGHRRTTGGLSELFGVQHAGFEYAHREPDYLAGVIQTDDLVPKGQWYIDAWYEKTLRLVDGVALGKHFVDGVPAFITKRTGHGRALLLNFLLDSPGVDTPGANEYALMAQVVGAARVKRIARVESVRGTSDTYAELNCFNDGANEYVGFYAQHDAEDPAASVVARFENAKETYDVRAGTYLGRVSQVPVPTHDGEAALFARLNYRVTNLSLTANPARRGERVSVNIALGTTAPAGRHVVHVDVIAPDGQRSYFYSRNVEISGGAGQMQFVTALNDLSGSWQIEAREVVSGISAATQLELE